MRERLDGNAKITEQVPPIGNLDRRGGPLTDPVSIGAGAIVGDDLDPRVVAEPRDSQSRVVCCSLTLKFLAFTAASPCVAHEITY